MNFNFFIFTNFYLFPNGGEGGDIHPRTSSLARLLMALSCGVERLARHPVGYLRDLRSLSAGNDGRLPRSAVPAEGCGVGDETNSS